MKKVLSICLIICAILATGCKNKNVTTIYSIGCLDFTISAETDVAGFQDYMKSVVDYNSTLQFSGQTIEENDVKAKTYFREQVAKVNTETACSYIHGNEYIVYGISRNDEETSKTIDQVKYTGNGVIGK